jgi:hypothetical protein
MRNFDRRTFVIGSAASAAAFGAGGLGLGRAAQAIARPDRRAAVRGVNADTDREYWNADFVPGEMATIANDLHANAVILLGHDVDRLMVAARAAAEHGLGVWIEARQFDQDAATTLDFVTTVAREAEGLRRDHPDVALSVACEATIFMSGIVPGADYAERATNLTNPTQYNAALNAFLADAVSAVRPIFGGTVTYTSGEWEEVVWDDFDVLGVDLYRDASNRAGFADHVQSLHRHGKPIVITEFGCCTFTGADDLGGLGFTVIDFSVDPPGIAPEYTRDEALQAGEIEAQLDIFEAAGVHGTFVYEFITPGAPHIPEYPQYDYDKASFALVKCYAEDHELAYATTGHYEPKLAFEAVARRFGAS